MTSESFNVDNFRQKVTYYNIGKTFLYVTQKRRGINLLSVKSFIGRAISIGPFSNKYVKVLTLSNEILQMP